MDDILYSLFLVVCFAAGELSVMLFLIWHAGHGTR